MSRATGTAAGGAGAERRGGSTGTGSDPAAARGSAAAASKAGKAGKGGTVTEARDAEPYHPPKAYAPPAEGASARPAAKGAAKAKPAAAARTTGGGKGDGAPAAAAGERRVPPPRPAASAVPAAPVGPRTRKARLRVAKADPWSVMKVSFLLSIALGVCTIVAATVLWLVMDAMGVLSAVGGTIKDATGAADGGGFDLQSFLSLPNVLLFTSLIAVIDVVLATALATLAAFVYNLAAGFVGGVELTLAEDE
ncbi:DUF3566 domain-containing protein [Streptomyces gamaensis]|uniref:DUF3566 domain-containing protein n=1 Tax=Streptomyces gamaensis TaxID=1763542 RepID=A0ABW0YY47_9ACTN